MSYKNLSLFGLLISVLSIVALLIRKAILASGVIGIIIQFAAVILMIRARLTLGRRSFHAGAAPTEGGLITTGPYKYFRHPIYAAILYFIWSGIIDNWSLINFFLGVIISSGLAIRMIAEEKLVAQKYPEYISYAAITKRIIPFIL